MDDFFGKPLYEVKKDPAPALAELSAALDSAIAGTQQMPQPAAASYGYGSNILGSQDPHLSDYLRIVYKRRWTALTAFGVIMLSVCLYTFTTTPIYEARAQVLIENLPQDPLPLPRANLHREWEAPRELDNGVIKVGGP